MGRSVFGIIRMVGAVFIAGVMVLAGAPIMPVQSAPATRQQEYLGQIASFGGPYMRPMGVALALDGTVYVADDFTRRVLHYSADGTVIGQVGLGGYGEDRLSTVVGIDVDKDGNLYAVDSNRCRVQKLSPAGAHLGSYGNSCFGSGDGQLFYPSDVAVDADGNIYVADTVNDRVQKFGTDFAYLSQFGGVDSPMALALDSNGDIYVTDSMNRGIKKFDANGDFILGFGSEGTGDGEFGWPVGLAVDADDNIYVSDAHNDNIQKFDSLGNFISRSGTLGNGLGDEDEHHWGPHGIAVGRDGAIYTANNYDNDIQKLSADYEHIVTFDTPNGDGKLNSPEGMATDRYGNMYIADALNNRVVKLDRLGNQLLTFGTRGKGDGQFVYPYDVAVTDDGSIYVVDFNNHRIQKFDSSGNYVSQFGAEGMGDGQLMWPRGIALDAAGNIYVVDYLGSVQKFDSNGTFVFKVDVLDNAYGITLDAQGAIYVTDSEYSYDENRYINRITKFSAEGSMIMQILGDVPADEGGFSWPRGVAVDTRGRIYVADSENGRIQVFDVGGEFMYTLGSFGQGPGQMGVPSGLVSDVAGNLLISDSDNHRVLSYGYAGDRDGDGVTDEVEDAAPNNGDANNDGIADSIQPHVTGVAAANGSYMSVVSPDGCVNAGLASVSEQDLPVRDSGYDYPAGFLNFTSFCNQPHGFTASLQVYVYGIAADGLALRKYHPSNNAFFTIPGHVEGLSVGGATAAGMSYDITDGGQLDADDIADGKITDPIGLGRAVVGAPNTGLSTK